MVQEAKETESTTPSMTPEQTRQERKAAQLLAFNRWRLDWRAANPEANKDDRREAWKAARKSEVRKSRKALRALVKRGYRLESGPA
ncbi:hypothetical protein [Maritimibacter fusiformis]|uniref:Uncharacterized protein n=1 Tax=Maritimibacter fusiformis TaxID=2603819 RepID=A0A5D0RIA8_9RHOB|nr:hypothetical protein [Maritimibacter fusiformis]TYB81252.1 hypothetical protein FVF75_08975 [Maritimibacter fusiformis]